MLGRYTLSRPIQGLGLTWGSTKPTTTVQPTTIRSPFSSQRIRIPTWGPKPAPAGGMVTTGGTVDPVAVAQDVTIEAQNGADVSNQPLPDVAPDDTVVTGPLPEDNSTPSTVVIDEPANPEGTNKWENILSIINDPGEVAEIGPDMYAQIRAGETARLTPYAEHYGITIAEARAIEKDKTWMPTSGPYFNPRVTLATVLAKYGKTEADFPLYVSGEVARRRQASQETMAASAMAQFGPRLLAAGYANEQAGMLCLKAVSLGSDQAAVDFLEAAIAKPFQSNTEAQATADSVAKKDKQKKVVRNVGIAAGITAVVGGIIAAMR